MHMKQKLFPFILLISGLIFGLFLFVGIPHFSFAQSYTAALTFNPAQISAEAGETKDVTFDLSGEEGISGFNIMLQAENATIESIHDQVQVSGGNAQSSDFQKVLDYISDDKTQAKISFVTISLNDEDLPTKISVSITAKKSGTEDGVISFKNDSTVEVIGKNGITYSVNATNNATLTAEGGDEDPGEGEDDPGDGDGQTSCTAYWAIGDANCSGGKPNSQDFVIWRNAYLSSSTGEKEGCTNIRADFNNDTKVDMGDFEAWRKGKYGSTSNSQKQWPQNCM